MSIYTHQNHAAPLARSNSFFGTIKNIVTAPFSWFGGSDDEFEDTKGKRRRLPAASEDTHMEDESVPSRAKRMRVNSPDRDTQPYLDPPRSAFTQPRRTSDKFTSGAVRDITRSPRKTLHIPSTSNQLPRNRRTLSPLPSGLHLKPQGITRTMSLDPPSHSSFSSRIQAAPTILDLQSEPNHAGDSMSTSRDVSMSPRRLRVRSSLTPQPSNSGFGPVVPPRREPGPDEPPPLTALMSNPMFVKPPPAVQKQVVAEPQKQLTLGTLIDSQRSARAPARQSSILFGTGSMTDVSAPGHLWPVNKAEMALHELEVYKTPLLPTRLKGATAVPDMFLHKEKKHITLMTEDRPVKPRLGTKSKGKEKGKRKERESMNGTKPYAGEGGMKKWLARRKKEEEEAQEKERAEAMEDERAEEENKCKEAEVQKKKREEELKVPPPPPPAPVFEPRVSREGPISSLLRVGRTRIGRNHIERPVSRRAKFSAAFEDEDEDMEESRAAEQKVLEEAAGKAPAFEFPAGFTFAKEIIITHDLTHAKEPPITSLPFSLTKPTPLPSAAEIVNPALIPVLTTPAPALPKIALMPPTPDAVKVAPEAPAIVAPISGAAAIGVPNFFAGSSVLAKAPNMTTPPASFFTASAVEQLKPSEVPESHVPKTADAVPSPFALPTLPKAAEKPTTAPPSLAPPFAFGAPARPVESVPVPTPNRPSEQPPPAELAKPIVPSNGIPLFGAPPPAPSAPASILTPAAPAAIVEAPKSDFTFGQPAPVTTSTTVPGTGDSTTYSQYSQISVPVLALLRPEEKPAANPFSFATSSTAEKKPTTGFTFGSSTASTAAPVVPSAFSFGATPSGTTAADVSSKPFTFGPTASARPVTPPKAVQEVTMDESPARDMVLNGNGKAPERPTLDFSFNTPSGSALFAQSPATTTAPFNFGAPGATVNPFAKEEKKETKPAVSFAGFGQTSSTGFSFSQKPPESPVTTAPAPAPFQFSQPSPTAAPASPFSFAAPASTGPFGQPSTASAPSSPSTFNRPASFTFRDTHHGAASSQWIRIWDRQSTRFPCYWQYYTSVWNDRGSTIYIWRRGQCGCHPCRWLWCTSGTGGRIVVYDGVCTTPRGRGGCKTNKRTSATRRETVTAIANVARWPVDEYKDVSALFPFVSL
ncbi:hypothetical protein J3R82DRAFT_5312 [Butyriboletus roseoflavus]|nr:hypothetical protein J3R82DRAFT_5312 [Butyriboletus roseoflavus]